MGEIKKMKIKPEYVVYKNDYPLAQCVTWHKGVDILYKHTDNPILRVYIVSGYVMVTFENDVNLYKIIKER